MTKAEQDPDFFKGKVVGNEEEVPIIDEGNEEGGDGGFEDNNVWDEKEMEARESVKEFFLETVDELNEVNRIIEHLMDEIPEFVGGKYRIDVAENDYKIISRMADLNKLISESNIFLKNYIDFGKVSSPNFDYIKNLMFLFQENLMKEQARRFAIVQKRNYNKIYITKSLIDYYLKGIHIWISRITGALVVAGDYIITVPPRRDVGNMVNMEGIGERGEEGYIDRGNNDYDDVRYANNSPWWDKGSSTSYLRTGSKVRPRLRDIGDAHTK